MLSLFPFGLSVNSNDMTEKYHHDECLLGFNIDDVAFLKGARTMRTSMIAILASIIPIVVSGAIALVSMWTRVNATEILAKDISQLQKNEDHRLTVIEENYKELNRKIDLVIKKLYPDEVVSKK